MLTLLRRAILWTSVFSLVWTVKWSTLVSTPLKRADTEHRHDHRHHLPERGEANSAPGERPETAAQHREHSRAAESLPRRQAWESAETHGHRVKLWKELLSEKRVLEEDEHAAGDGSAQNPQWPVSDQFVQIASRREAIAYSQALRGLMGINEQLRAHIARDRNWPTRAVLDKRLESKRRWLDSLIERHLTLQGQSVPTPDSRYLVCEVSNEHAVISSVLQQLTSCVLYAIATSRILLVASSNSSKDGSSHDVLNHWEELFETPVELRLGKLIVQGGVARAGSSHPAANALIQDESTPVAVAVVHPDSADFRCQQLANCSVAADCPSVVLRVVAPRGHGWWGDAVAGNLHLGWRDRLPPNYFQVVAQRYFPVAKKVTQIVDEVFADLPRRVIAVDNDFAKNDAAELERMDGTPRVPVDLDLMLQAADEIAGSRKWDSRTTAFLLLNGDANLEKKLEREYRYGSVKKLWVLPLHKSFRGLLPPPIVSAGTGSNASDGHKSLGAPALRRSVKALAKLIAASRSSDVVAVELGLPGLAGAALSGNVPPVVCSPERFCTRRISLSPPSGARFPIRKTCGKRSLNYWPEKHDHLSDGGDSLFLEDEVMATQPFMQFTDIEGTGGEWRQHLRDCHDYGCPDDAGILRKAGLDLPPHKQGCVDPGRLSLIERRRNESGSN